MYQFHSLFDSQIHSLQLENAEKKQAVQELTSVLNDKIASYDEILVPATF